MRSVARTPPDVHHDIVLVEINDTTIRDLDPVFGRWPWPRAAFSILVDFLNRAPAKVIAVDLGFYERDRVLQHQIGTEKWSGAESDDALVNVGQGGAGHDPARGRRLRRAGERRADRTRPPNGARSRIGSDRRHLRAAHDHHAVS